MHVAYGLVRRDAGDVRVDGVARSIGSPGKRVARHRHVHQHFTAVPALTVAENVALAAGWSVRPRELAPERGR